MNLVAAPLSSKRIVLKAPLSGLLVAIESIPDPVFAQKMVGDGISIDPLDECLRAPCDGEVLQLHSAGHAVTMMTEDELEVMIHIGLDTVELNGRGFTPRVRAGDRVKTGDALIDFDADFVAMNARSLLTQIVITNSELVSRFEPLTGTVRAGEDDILGLWLGEPPDSASSPAAGKSPLPDQDIRQRHSPAVASPASLHVPARITASKGKPKVKLRAAAHNTGLKIRSLAANSLVSDEIAVPNESGLHARPAAVLANMAKKYSADIRLQRGEQTINAKSVVAIMGLEVNRDDRIRLLARGEDAEQALATLVPLLAAGLGDEGLAPAPAPASVSVSEFAYPAPRLHATDQNLIEGVTASPGLAIGSVFQFRSEKISIEEFGQAPHTEQRFLDHALAEGMVQLEALQARLHEETDPGKAAIFAAHQELLDDPELLDLAYAEISGGKSAAWAWNNAINIFAERFSALKNSLLAERANDLRDVGRRILRLLTDTRPAEQDPIPEQSILVTEELTPSTTAHLNRDNVLGFCTLMGGASSHVAILARALDIPAVAGVESRILDIANGTPVILDGDAGTLRLNPTPEQLADAGNRIDRHKGDREQYLRKAREPAITWDGTAIEVDANIGSLADAREAVRCGAGGVGLLRTEFLFMNRTTAPSEDEQYQVYRDIIAALEPGQPLVIRTLDVGGDKPLPYLPIPRENNPFLGERGIRVGLDRPEILRLQVRAILRSARHGRVSIMLPMVTTIDDVRRARALVEEERQKLGIEPVPLGIMVEVPAVALMASRFVREADFFSIGTNDLTQYTLAMDRDHPRLAATIDALSPAVLSLIEATIKGAGVEGRWVGVCGDIASDPRAVPILLGLGITKLSCTVPTIPRIKALIRTLRLADCRELSRRALEMDSAMAVRALYPDSQS